MPKDNNEACVRYDPVVGVLSRPFTDWWYYLDALNAATPAMVRAAIRDALRDAAKAGA